VIRQTTTLSLLVLGAFSVNSIVQSRCFSFYSSSGEQLPRQLGTARSREKRAHPLLLLALVA
jgi:hypothetical protein